MESPFSFERLRERRALISAPVGFLTGQAGIGARIEQKPHDWCVATDRCTNQRIYIAVIAFVDVRARLEQEANNVDVAFISGKNQRRCDTGMRVGIRPFAEQFPDKRYVSPLRRVNQKTIPVCTF